MLLAIGYYKELSGDVEAETIHTYIDKMPKEYKNKIIKYLSMGKTLIEHNSHHYDILSNLNTEIGPAKTLTDGLLVYESDLIYYIDKYDLGIPEFIMNYLKEKNFEFSTSLDTNDIDLIEGKMLGQELKYIY